MLIAASILTSVLLLGSHAVPERVKCISLYRFVVRSSGLLSVMPGVRCLKHVYYMDSCDCQMLATALLHLVGGDPSLTEPLRSDSASVELLLRFEVRRRARGPPLREALPRIVCMAVINPQRLTVPPQPHVTC